jgi:hypothetical protein
MYQWLRRGLPQPACFRAVLCCPLPQWFRPLLQREPPFAGVPVEMPDNIVRLDDFERKAVMSPLGELALDMVEFMGKAGLTTAPKDPTDEMVAADVEASGITATQVRAIFKAMIAAYDASDLGVSDNAG